MREIKFKYGYSDGIITFEKAFTLEEIEQGLQFEEISDSPLLKNYKIVYKRQYTGLKDKNGVEIYEGDIVSFTLFDCFDNDMQHIGKILFNNGAFYIEYMDKYELYNSLLCYVISQDDEFEVIGNICENSDVLKG